MIKLRGKVSYFGGPLDLGVSASEGLALYFDYDERPEIFLDEQPPGTSGLARRLNADEIFYLATRWDYDQYPKTYLVQHMALVRSPKTGRMFRAYPVDWGPAGPESDHDTGRVADISPALMEALQISTDDEVEVYFPFRETDAVPDAETYPRICISSGHGKYVRGASGVLDEVDEARRVVELLADKLRERDVAVQTFHDDTSHDQSTNLETIVDWHNSQSRDLDVSVHFNAYVETDKPMGTECLYVTQSVLAADVASAVAECGFINRGAKYRDDLFFLNQTAKPSILIETCFVDSQADADLYNDMVDEIASNIADVLGGPE